MYKNSVEKAFHEWKHCVLLKSSANIDKNIFLAKFYMRFFVFSFISTTFACKFISHGKRKTLS